MSLELLVETLIEQYAEKIYRDTITNEEIDHLLDPTTFPVSPNFDNTKSITDENYHASDVIKRFVSRLVTVNQPHNMSLSQTRAFSKKLRDRIQPLDSDAQETHDDQNNTITYDRTLVAYLNMYLMQPPKHEKIKDFIGKRQGARQSSFFSLTENQEKDFRLMNNICESLDSYEKHILSLASFNDRSSAATSTPSVFSYLGKGMFASSSSTTTNDPKQIFINELIKLQEHYSKISTQATEMAANSLSDDSLPKVTVDGELRSKVKAQIAGELIKAFNANHPNIRGCFQKLLDKYGMFSTGFFDGKSSKFLPTLKAFLTQSITPTLAPTSKI